MIPGSARVVLRVTCGRDGYEHLVNDEAMTPGCAGRYPALCGHPVWAAVLACPSGPPCLACVAVRRAQIANERGHRWGVWSQLLDRWRGRRRVARSGAAPFPNIELALPDDTQSDAARPAHTRNGRVAPSPRHRKGSR